jgi:transcriptional regulator with XRE-family HTH domain
LRVNLSDQGINQINLVVNKFIWFHLKFLWLIDSINLTMQNNDNNRTVPIEMTGSDFSSDLEKESRNHENFFARLKLRRENLGYSQKNLAEMVGVSSNTIQSWEKNTHPKGNDLVLLAKYLNCSIDWLLKGFEHRSDSKNEIPPTQPGQKSKLQTGLLRTIIRAIENELHQRDLELDPDKKAEAISLLYEMYADTEKEVTEQTVVRYLKLVA